MDIIKLPSGNFLDLEEYCFFEVMTTSQNGEPWTVRLSNRHLRETLDITGEDAPYLVRCLENRRSRF